MSADPSNMAASPLLLGLASDEVSSLLAIAESRRYERGESVVQEGTASDCLFILETGAVQVQRSEDGQTITLAEFDQPGDFFGEMSLIDILPRSADIHAEIPSEILAFPKKELTSFFTSSPRVQMTMILNIARNLSLRLREADARIVELSKK